MRVYETVWLREYDRLARDKGITYQSSWSKQELQPSVFPGSFHLHYQVCLILPEYRHPDNSIEYVHLTRDIVHEVYLQPELIAYRSG